MEALAPERTQDGARVLQILSELDLLEFAPATPARDDNWSELCKWGAVAAGFLCLTSSIAALILTYARHL